MWSAFWADDVAGIVSLPNGFKWHLLWLLPLQLLAGLLLAWGLAIGLRARRANYRKRLIPALGGLCLLVPCIFLAVLAGIQAQVSPNIDSPAVALIGCLLGWMLLGLVDDLAGTAENKGFRGHLRALLHGKLTTGGIKLLGGGLLALGMAGLSIHTGPRLLTIPLAALVIALSANALNLFDLRPGRALKVWWLGAIPLILWPACATDLPWSPAGLYPSYWALAGTLLLLTTLLYAPLDFGAMMMLGDTGSNPLGALLGLLIVVSTPWPGQLVVLALLIALHVYAERASITWLIARVPVLTWLDRLGRGDT
jgi:UDP-N-acetylmuramyl pentapeptide phosphotransferase/UDP-N-acetylglucosamine-1-phosphate transferase